MYKDNLSVDSKKESLLSLGNRALENKEYNKAIEFFENSKNNNSLLNSIIDFNISIARSKINSSRMVSHNSGKKDNLSIISLNSSNDFDARLEKYENFTFRGWAVNKSKPSQIFDLSVFVDDVFYVKIKNDISRNDLKKAGKSNGKGGYNFSIPQEILNSNAHDIRIEYPDGSLFLRCIVDGVEQIKSNDVVLLPVERNISIIVPIYNAVDDVEICIERLKKYTPSYVDIILINDASSDPKINEILDTLNGHKMFRVFHNEKNLGFTKTVNKGITLANDNDVILLNSDARVTPRWIQGFQRALRTDNNIATVTAMSDRAGAFSAPRIGNDNELPAGILEEDYAVAFRRKSIGYYPTVPTGNGFCMYIRRACINSIGPLDAEAFPRGYGEENDFCMRARDNGWRNIIDDRTYVFHDRSKSFGGQKDELIKAGRAVIDQRYPDFKKSISIFTQSPIISAARFKAGLAIKDCDKLLPRGLFVISTLTGGTPQTNRDLMLALSDRIEGWLLHCDSKIMSLYRISNNQPDQLIRRHILKEEVEVLTHYCSEYDRVITNWLYEYDFDFVHIRHLAWHSLSLPKLAKECGARVINSFHDFYTICPTVKLLDGDNKYCNGICSNSKNGNCKPDLWGSDSLPSLKNAWVNKWREKFSHALSFCDAFVTTHESVRKTILENLAIPSERFHVIPHGRDFDNLHQLAEPYKNGDILKILIPGNIAVAKGSKIIEEILKTDVKEKLHFHILGKSNLNFQHPRLTFHGEYKRDEFADHVKKIKPHIGAVFSIWNETWCHTLTELWSVGLPVMVTRYLTVSSRVKSTETGWIIDETDLLQLIKFCYDIICKESEITSKRRNVETLQLKGLVSDSNSKMAKEYLLVYENSKVSFKTKE
ncbi:glycosyltransferase [Vibrio metschnikovii]|nr:glycosyltransferase [Vibrio metschnikovii]EKO3777308.1 glycosyltransferase [Vibrio metschnikovii]